jgi:hypothetical protein
MGCLNCEKFVHFCSFGDEYFAFNNFLKKVDKLQN